MPAERISYLDVLREGTDKLNDAIDIANKVEIDSATAVSTADGAVVTADEAKAKAFEVEAGFDLVVAEAGTNNPEVVQARGGEVNLNARLNSHATQLSDAATKAEVAVVQTSVSNLSTKKADVTYVNQQVQISNNAWQGSYATLSDLQAAFPTGDTKKYAIVADGFIYFWNGSAWTNSNIVAVGINVPKKSITAAKTDFFDEILSKNLINPNDMVTGFYVSETTGLFSVSASYKRTGYIPVKAGTYIFSANQTAIALRYALYDNGKTFKSGALVATITASAINTGWTNRCYTIIEVPQDGYLVASVTSGTLYIQLETGEHTLYEEYQEPEYVFDNTFIKPKSLTSDKFSMDIPETVPTVNMYNKDARIDGYYVNNVSGALEVNASHVSSDFMLLRGFEKYIVNIIDVPNFRVAWYNTNNDSGFISGIKAPSFPLAPPTNAVYVRFSYVKSVNDANTIQFQGGDAVTEYEAHGITIQNLVTNNTGNIKDEVLAF
jgi:hypothetical protein